MKHGIWVARIVDVVVVGEVVVVVVVVVGKGTG